MPYAFLEELHGDRVFIIRAGPDALKYLDPWQIAVAAECHGTEATVKALSAPKCEACGHAPKFGHRYASIILDAVKAAGYRPTWERGALRNGSVAAPSPA